MKQILVFFAHLIVLCSPAFAAAPGEFLPADEAMQRLKEGNARHVAGNTVHSGQGEARREELARTGQQPVATILGCSDSRAPLEIILDQGVGDIFVVRVAGNLAGPNELGSIEYGVASLGTPVVLVLGHSSCGAVSAALHNASASANVSEIINQIRPAVAKARAWSPNASGAELVNKSVKANVWQSMETVLRKSREVRERVQDGRILLVGGVYDLESGQVAWLGQHPEQGRILAAIHAAQHKPRPKAQAVPKVMEQGEPAAEAAKPQQSDSADFASAPAAGQANTAAPQDVAPPAAKPAAKPPARPASKPASKPVAKPAAKPAAKIDAKPAAKPAEAAEPSSGYNPQARSEGDGELLAPMPEKTPAKSSSKETGKKGS
ncbi:carbonic anhydrase [Humidesulfovibrio sp.]